MMFAQITLASYTLTAKDQVIIDKMTQKINLMSLTQLNSVNKKIDLFLVQTQTNQRLSAVLNTLGEYISDLIIEKTVMEQIVTGYTPTTSNTKNKPDLTIAAISLKSVDSMFSTFSVTVKNIGTADYDSGGGS